MTVSQAIKQWLYKNGTIEIDERINTEKLDSQAIAYSLSKTPQSQLKKFAGGNELRTEYYMFFARQSSQIETERISNDEFLENLENWVWEKNKERDYPILDKKRTCTNIGISSTYYAYSTEEEETIYTFTISIEYLKRA